METRFWNGNAEFWNWNVVTPTLPISKDGRVPASFQYASATSALDPPCQYRENLVPRCAVLSSLSRQSRPHPKGAGPIAPNFGVPFSLCVHPLSQKYQIWHGNICGEVTCFRGHPRAQCTQGAGFQRSPILWVPFYLCVHPLSQNFQIWRGNTCGRGVYPAWGQPRLPSQDSGVPGIPNFATPWCYPPLGSTAKDREMSTHACAPSGRGTISQCGWLFGAL